MKYLFLSTFCVVSTILGVAATALADVSITMPIEPTNRSNSVSNSNKSTQPIVANKLELEIYDRINKYRQSQNLPPLAFDPIVAEQARAHSQDMARQSILSHDGFHERFESVSEALSVQSVAENVATNRGYSQPELIAVQSWIESPGHHHNIIGRYNATGIGVIQNARGEYYFTQIFVRKVQ